MDNTYIWDKEVQKQRRKIIQISTSRWFIYALCDDGTVWRRDSAIERPWVQIEDRGLQPG